MASTRWRCRARRPASSPTRATATRRSCASSPSAILTRARARRRSGRRGLSRRDRRRRRHDARPRRHRPLGDRDRPRARCRARRHLHRRQRRDDRRSAARSRRARTIERASLAEMTELGRHGAKVMHHKAAEYANRTGTRYAIKGLRTDRGTLVDERVDHHRPVTGRDVVGARDVGAHHPGRHRVAGATHGDRARDVPPRRRGRRSRSIR